MIDYRQEALKRLNNRNVESVRWTLKDRTIEYKYIPANQARNTDGSAPGLLLLNNPKFVLQSMFWKTGENPRYTNFWSVYI